MSIKSCSDQNCAFISVLRELLPVFKIKLAIDKSLGFNAASNANWFKVKPLCSLNEMFSRFNLADLFFESSIAVALK